MEPSRLNIAGKTATSAQNASKEMKISDRCTLLEQHAFSLRFKSRALEAAYLRGVAASRLPVLIAIASFDICMYLLQLALSTSVVPIGVVSVPKNAAFAQLRNLACLYSLIAAIHWRSMNSGFSAGQVSLSSSVQVSMTLPYAPPSQSPSPSFHHWQGELLLSCLLSGMLTILVRAVGSSQSWVYVSFFLICTSQVLRLRWFVGAAAMALPVIFCICRSLRLAWDPEQDFQGLFPFLKVSTVGIMSSEIMFQLAAAWAVGTLMGFLSDSSRREAFANHRRALAAANTELTEVRARVAAEHELAAAQSVAEARSALAAREKASNEAKSDFISMLCHEIRTPLNGCLASAEMLLQTDLSVSDCYHLSFSFSRSKVFKSCLLLPNSTDSADCICTLQNTLYRMIKKNWRIQCVSLALFSFPPFPIFLIFSSSRLESRWMSCAHHSASQHSWEMFIGSFRQ